MSFDIYHLRFSKGEGCELSREAIRAVLQKYEFKQSGEHFYYIRFQGNHSVELLASGLSGSEPFKACSFSLRSMSDDIVRFVFECAKATGGVLIPTMENNPCIMVDATQRAELPADFTLPLVECPSAEHLAELLDAGYKSWSGYRNQVVQGRTKENLGN